MEVDPYYAELATAGGASPYAWKRDTPLPAGLLLVPLPDSQMAVIQSVPAEARSTSCVTTQGDAWSQAGRVIPAGK